VAVGEIDVGKVDGAVCDVGSVSSVTERCRRRRDGWRVVVAVDVDGDGLIDGAAVSVLTVTV